TPTTEIYTTTDTLSLHDALPISAARRLASPSDSLELGLENVRAADAREPEKSQKTFLVIAFAFGCDLCLYDCTVRGEHEVAVAACLAVLLIIEVQYCCTVVNAAAYGSNLSADGINRD